MITFRHTGLSPVEEENDQYISPLRKQLKHFCNSLIVQGMQKSECPDNWMDAFLLLELFCKAGMMERGN